MWKVTTAMDLAILKGQLGVGEPSQAPMPNLPAVSWAHFPEKKMEPRGYSQGMQCSSWRLIGFSTTWFVPSTEADYVMCNLGVQPSRDPTEPHDKKTQSVWLKAKPKLRE